MEQNKDTQGAFLEAMNSLKEYAKVNGGFVTKDDVDSYFKDMELDEGKRQMIYGYLMANNIKVKGEATVDNDFLNMMENAVEHDREVEAGIHEEEEESPKKDVDYSADEKYLEMYKEDLKNLVPLSDMTKALLLVNIAEDNDKESLKLLSEAFLDKIIEWIEPFRYKGVLAGDLVQEGNLAMMAYISEKRFLNNYEWREKIKEGNVDDVMAVFEEMTKEVQSEVNGSLSMLIDEQSAEDKVSQKVLNKVNLVNDWAVRLKEELGRKPTVDELADKIGISKENVMEAIQLSAENIEDVAMDKKNS